MIPLLLGLGAVGAIGMQLVGSEGVTDAAEDLGGVIGPVMSAAVSGTYAAIKSGIRNNEVEVFTALTVIALTVGAYKYTGALLSR